MNLLSSGRSSKEAPDVVSAWHISSTHLFQERERTFCIRPLRLLASLFPVCAQHPWQTGEPPQCLYVSMTFRSAGLQESTLLFSTVCLISFNHELQQEFSDLWFP